MHGNWCGGCCSTQGGKEHNECVSHRFPPGRWQTPLHKLCFVAFSYRSIGHMFGVAKGTVCVIVNEVCQAIVKVLLKTYAKFPAASNEIEE